MEFMVRRTSRKTPPCDGAVKGPYVKTVAWEGEALEAWRSRGNNHREEHGEPVRDLVEVAWFVEVDDLEALLELVPEAKNGLVLSQDGGFEIEIYDDYRE